MKYPPVIAAAGLLLLATQQGMAQSVSAMPENANEGRSGAIDAPADQPQANGQEAMREVGDDPIAGTIGGMFGPLSGTFYVLRDEDDARNRSIWQRYRDGIGVRLTGYDDPGDADAEPSLTITFITRGELAAPEVAHFEIVHTAGDGMVFISDNTQGSMILSTMTTSAEGLGVAGSFDGQMIEIGPEGGALEQGLTMSLRGSFQAVVPAADGEIE